MGVAGVEGRGMARKGEGGPSVRLLSACLRGAAKPKENLNPLHARFHEPYRAPSLAYNVRLGHSHLPLVVMSSVLAPLLQAAVPSAIYAGAAALLFKYAASPPSTARDRPSYDCPLTICIIGSARPRTAIA